MAEVELTPEQQQLQQEIKAVEANLAKSGDAANHDFEIEQGRKLIEKAVKIGLPTEAYVDLQRHMTDREGEAGVASR